MEKKVAYSMDNDLYFMVKHTLSEYFIRYLLDTRSFWDTQTTLSATNNHSMVKVT